VTIRILIADDHPVVRDGLGAILATQPDLEVVGEATTGGEALATARRSQPDVVLMDLQMPEVDGATATAILRDEQPDIKVLVLTTYDTDADITRALEAGATGFLLKDAHRDDLVGAIRTAARGEAVLSPTVATRMVSRMRSGHASTLSGREIEVLSGVARGLSNKRIAETLYLSEATVKTHLLHIFQKLGVDDRTAAVTTALERGIIRVDR
jgi:DNA-binding NarL/FixJ family response regulator